MHTCTELDSVNELERRKEGKKDEWKNEQYITPSQRN